MNHSVKDPNLNRTLSHQAENLMGKDPAHRLMSFSVKPPRPKSALYKKGQTGILLMMALPVFLIGVVFNYGPLWGWIMAFFDFNPGIPIWQSPFVGLQYFAQLFESGSDFLLALRNTLVLAGLGLLVLPLSAVFAVVLAEFKGAGFKKYIQFATALPYFVSWIIVYSVFAMFLSIDEGMVNKVLLATGIVSQPISFLADPGYSWGIMAFINVWKGLGYTAIIFIAAIAGVDPALHEAAEIDGAGRFARIMNVTVPAIMPTFAVLLILNIGQLLNIGFEQYYTFQNNLTIDHLEILDTYVYRQGLVKMNFSYSTAVGVFKSVVSLGLLVLGNQLYKRQVGRSLF